MKGSNKATSPETGLNTAGWLAAFPLLRPLKWAVAGLLLIPAFAISAWAGPLEDADAAYQRGEHATAARIYQTLADQGNANAQNRLGDLYYNGLGVPQDYAKALSLYRRAAEQGQISAQDKLGPMYLNGRGTRQDFNEARKWFRRAAALGSASAQFGLGEMYLRGQGGEQDLLTAARWYSRAAEQGHAKAQYALGVMYQLGGGIRRSRCHRRC